MLSLLVSYFLIASNTPCSVQRCLNLLCCKKSLSTTQIFILIHNPNIIHFTLTQQLQVGKCPHHPNFIISVDVPKLLFNSTAAIQQKYKNHSAFQHITHSLPSPFKQITFAFQPHTLPFFARVHK